MGFLKDLVFGRRVQLVPDVRPGTNITILDNGITKTVSETTSAQVASGWTDDGANVRLTTAADTTSIGTATPSSGMKLTVSGNIGPEADGTRDIGSTTLRMNDVIAKRVLSGVGPNAGGQGMLNTAAETNVFNIESDVAVSDSASRMAWLIRRNRGTLASKTNVLTGDAVASVEYQADPAGSGGFVEVAKETVDIESRTGTTAIGARIRWFTRANAAASVDTVRLELTANGNVVVGNQAAALATTAVDGFLHIPSCAGVPTGVPTLYTGSVPMVYDTTNLRLYVYAAGAWRIH